MTSIVGNAAAQAAFAAAMAGNTLHHAWLLVGPEGVGKGSFARAMALRMLALAHDRQPAIDDSVLEDHPVAKLIRAGSHPDFRLIERLPKDADKPEGEHARSITIAQVRALQPMFATTPSLSPRRVVLIDAVDDLERGGANALLKNLEEPPAGTVFLLVSHSPGRLLATIRSRCRLLRFGPLDADEMRAAIVQMRPEAERDEVEALVRAGDGSPGRALRYAGLDLARIDAALERIARDGDPANRGRLALARALAPKAAQARYEAFLDRVPSFVAWAARLRAGEDLRRALDLRDEAQAIAGSARGLSLDPHGTVFELGGVVARLAAD